MAGGPLSPLEHKASDWDISTGGWCVRELIHFAKNHPFYVREVAIALRQLQQILFLGIPFAKAAAS
jgi:hypothetical protein